MKKIYLFIITIFILGSANNSNAQCIIWTDTFTAGIAPTPAQIATWNNFRSQLLGSYSYTKMTISGTYDAVGQSTSDPTIVLAYANALRNLTNYTSPLTNGNVWSLCGTRYQGEVWLNPPTECSGSNCPTGYIIRPGSGYSCCWGGVNTATCSSTPTQRMTFKFEYTPTSAPVFTCPSNITVNNDAGMCDAAVTYVAPSDACITITQTAGLASGASFPVGTTTNTFSATNNIGTTTCSSTVTVVDAEAPTVTCPASVASCDPLVNGIAPTTADNCTGETVAYTLTGVTTGSGANDASGTTFNVGVTTVLYTVTDASNNQDTCSFTVTINPLPTVAIAAFSPDTVCLTDPAFVLPVGTPAAGTYSGNGVSGSNFDPNAAGVGTHYVVYTFTDTNTCTNMDSTAVVVVSCVGINEANGLSGVNVFPNPANNVINVNLGAITTAVNFTLTSIDGKVVYQVNNVNDTKTAIDISNNAKGVYFLKVETNNKQQIFKVIKQ